MVATDGGVINDLIEAVGFKNMESCVSFDDSVVSNRNTRVNNAFMMNVYRQGTIA